MADPSGSGESEVHTNIHTQTCENLKGKGFCIPLHIEKKLFSALSVKFAVVKYYQK